MSTPGPSGGRPRSAPGFSTHTGIPPVVTAMPLDLWILELLVAQVTARMRGETVASRGLPMTSFAHPEGDSTRKTSREDGGKRRSRVVKWEPKLGIYRGRYIMVQYDIVYGTFQEKGGCLK